MSNIYLDIDSSYRNRNLWPLPGEFEILISQTGVKEKGYAYDPVCLSEPIDVWSCNGLTTSQPSTYQLAGILSPNNTYGDSCYTQTVSELTLIFTDVYNNTIQTEQNYYSKLIIQNVTKNTFSRIQTYTYIGNSGETNPEYSRALITVYPDMTFTFGDNFSISDSSDLSRPEYPLLFVPNGENQNNAYSNYILYCESNNDYRTVTFYDSVYKYISCEPWDGINNTNFQQYGNFCLRKEPPLFPSRLEASQFASTDSNLSTIEVNITGSCSLSKITNFYKNDFLRIRPYRTFINPPVFVVGGTSVDLSGNLAYSTDGLNWSKTGVINPLDSAIYAVTNNGPNSSSLLWVATGQSLDLSHTISYSIDAINWYASGSNPFVNPGKSIFYINGYWFIGSTSVNSGEYSFAVTDDPILGVYTNISNPFGTPFVNNGTNPGGEVLGISVNLSTSPNIYNVMVAGRNQINTTVGNILKGTFNANVYPPTLTWVQTTTNPFDKGVCNAIAYNGALWVAVGKNDQLNIGSVGICYSSDSMIFDAITTIGEQPFWNGQGLEISWNGSYWVAGGTSSFGSLTYTRSYDGITWEISEISQVSLNVSGLVASPNAGVWTGSSWIGALSSIYLKNPAIIFSSDGLSPTIIKTVQELFSCYALSIYNSNNFKNIGIYNQNLTSQSRQIISYTNDGATAIFNVYPPFSGTNLFATDNSYTIEVEAFSYDNCNPFTYIGTLVQQQSCCEFELIDLTLPNFTLSSGEGSKIAFYPYVYVILSNVSSAGSHLKNILSSNNPNAVKVIFKVPIYDIQDPFSTPFVRLSGINMIQTIKFNLNDNLFFSVLLPNGDIFNTLLQETYSPQSANENSQLSAMFRVKRL